MDRIPEPELMLDPDQSEAYAQADFSDAHNMFVDRCYETFDNLSECKQVLDLGCGTGDITMRFFKRHQQCHITAIDGSDSMLAWAHQALDDYPPAQGYIHFINTLLPTANLAHQDWDLIISNSLLHHLENPQVLWQTIKQNSQVSTKVFVMDLFRAQSETHAHELVDTYAKEEPEVLKTDFYNSLLAAFTIEEIKMQLEEAQLALKVEKVSDRHCVISGEL